MLPAVMSTDATAPAPIAVTIDDLPATLTSARLRLRLPSLGDARALVDGWVCDTEATRFMLFPTYAPGDVAAVEAFLATCIAAWQRRSGHRPWVVCRADDESDTPIGMLGVTPGHGPGGSEIGYIFRRASWGQGFASEAVRAVVAVLVGQLGAWRVFATTHVDNRGSQGVLAKAGFTREGTLRRYHVFPNAWPGATPEPADCTLWSFTRDDLATTHHQRDR